MKLSTIAALVYSFCSTIVGGCIMLIDWDINEQATYLQPCIIVSIIFSWNHFLREFAKEHCDRQDLLLGSVHDPMTFYEILYGFSSFMSLFHICIFFFLIGALIGRPEFLSEDVIAYIVFISIDMTVSVIYVCAYLVTDLLCMKRAIRDQLPEYVSQW